MSNLPSKQNQFVIHGYQFNENEYRVIKAIDSKSIIDIPEYDARKLIGVAIIKAARTAGQKNFSDGDITFIENGIFDYVKKRKSIKIDEIILAIDLGSLGEYKDDVVYVSVKSCVKWIKTYLEQKINLFKTLTMQKEKEAIRTAENASNENQKKYWQNFPQMINEEFIYYKANKAFTNTAWLICKNLQEIGYTDFLNISSEEKKSIYKQIEQEVIKEESDQIKSHVLVFNEKMIKRETLETEIKKRCFNKCLMIWFDKIEFIDLEKVKNLIKDYELRN